MNEVAVSQRFRPLTFVHGLIEQDARQSFPNVTLHLKPISFSVQEHFASHKFGRPSDVRLLVLRGHDSDIALPEFLLGFEHKHLDGSRQVSAKHGSEQFGLLIQDACDLSCDLVSLSVVVYLKHAILEILPFERAVLNAVLPNSTLSPSVNCPHVGLVTTEHKATHKRTSRIRWDWP